MKILIVTHYFPPHTGGIETVAEQHAHLLEKNGHDVNVLTTHKNRGVEVEPHHGYTIIRYGAYDQLERIGLPYPIPDPFDSLSVKSELEKKDYDIVHIHGFNYLTSLFGSIIFKDLSPILLQQHTPFIDYSFILNMAERFIDRTIGWYNVSSADKVLAVSKKIEKYTQSICSTTESQVFHNAVDVEKYHPQNSGSKSTKTEFFVLTRLLYKKGVDQILEATKKIQSPDFKLIIGGTGPDEEKIRNEASKLDSVSVEGYLSSEEVLEHYASADAFIFTSRTGDAFPTMSVLEAMASGTPIIATRVDRQMDGLENGYNGILVPPSNPIQIKNAMESIIQNPKKAIEMGHNARERVVNQYNIQHRVKELEEEYKILLNSEIDT